MQAHGVLGGQAAPVSLGDHRDRGQGQQEGGCQPQHYQGSTGHDENQDTTEAYTFDDDSGDEHMCYVTGSDA